MTRWGELKSPSGNAQIRWNLERIKRVVCYILSFHLLCGVEFIDVARGDRHWDRDPVVIFNRCLKYLFHNLWRSVPEKEYSIISGEVHYR